MVLQMPNDLVIYIYSTSDQAWIEFLAPSTPTDSIFDLNAHKCIKPLELSQEANSCQIYEITDRAEFIALFVAYFYRQSRAVTRYFEVQGWLIVLLVLSICMDFAVWTCFYQVAANKC